MVEFKGIDSAKSIPASEARRDNGAYRAVPVVWLLGKVQSGKTSIVRTLTATPEAEVGTGFRPCTRASRTFDFPIDDPVLRFLDTRGLGETNYVPDEDLALAEEQSDLVLVTMRAMDLNQRSVLDVISKLRSRRPDCPVIVAQTALHEGYPAGTGHIEPYPYSSEEPAKAHIPMELARALAHQRSLFSGLPGSAVIAFAPIDFTKTDDNLTPADYGIEALSDALILNAPTAMRPFLDALPGLANGQDARSIDAVILGHALAAAGSDLVPVAGAFAVTAVQARLVQKIAQGYRVQWDKAMWARFGGALGTGVAARTAVAFGVRQLTKLIPVYGQTVGAAASAASSFAVTYAIGKAAVHFLTRYRQGLPPEHGTASVYRTALQDAFLMARERNRGKQPSKAVS